MTLIRQMTLDEVVQLVIWAGHEGWNPGLSDAQCFWELDPNGFLALEASGQMIGGGATIRYDDTFGFMGLFIVETTHRRRGLGTRLWFERRDRLLARLNPAATIGLDAVDAMVPFYERGGFRPFTRHRRFKLNAPAQRSGRSNNVVEISTEIMPKVMDFDRNCFPACRAHYLKNWICQTGAISLAFVKDNHPLGFGVMRPCLSGWKIGPLFADSYEIANALFQAFLTTNTGQTVFLDAPDNNAIAIKLCKDHKMEEVFGCVRMYYGKPPELNNERIFGITTLEVG